MVDWGSITGFPGKLSSVPLDYLPGAVFIFDELNILVNVNRAALALINQTDPTPLGKQAASILTKVIDLLSSTPASEAKQLDLFDNPDFPGIYLRIQICPAFHDGRDEVNRMALLQDMGEKGGSLQQLGWYRSMLDNILDATQHSVLVVDENGKMIYQNQRMSLLWEEPPDSFEGDTNDWLGGITRHLKQPHRFLQIVKSVTKKVTIETYDYLELLDGRILECHSRQLPLETGGSARIWNFHDITEAHRKEDELRHLSTHDGLTGLYNRAYFESKLTQIRSTNQFPTSLIMVDVDGLKKINDRCGHEEGDALLRKASEVLKNACRAEDIVARLGGDEFGILLCQADNDIAEQVTDRINHLTTLQQIKTPDLPLSLSSGFATARDVKQMADLFRRADDAMYRLRYRRRSKAKENAEGKPETTSER
ncbi:MAG: sensor domain-containing diguanylate cyclase [Anaerolineaceae bacterium]|nr:sensor domain-containing diguanylate cyclase [Anaerolineaceae bacterium]